MQTLSACWVADIAELVSGDITDNAAGWYRSGAASTLSAVILMCKINLANGKIVLEEFPDL